MNKEKTIPSVLFLVQQNLTVHEQKKVSREGYVNVEINGSIKKNPVNSHREKESNLSCRSRAMGSSVMAKDFNTRGS